MDCGVPFCQSGNGCPLGNIIPKWNDLVYQVSLILWGHMITVNMRHTSHVPPASLIVITCSNCEFRLRDKLK